MAPQPLMAVLTVSAAAAALAGAWWLRGATEAHDLGSAAAILAAALVTAIVFAYRYPLHIRLATNVSVGSLALYLTAVLLPPYIAVVTGGVATLLGELAVQARTRNSTSDIATQAGRWSAVIFAGSLVAHVHPAGMPHALVLTLAAAALWTGDVLTCPLVYYPLIREHPVRIMRLAVQGSGVIEMALYTVGILAAFEAERNPWALTLFAVPVLLVHRVFRHSNEVQRDTLRVLESMADAVDLRDPCTGGHSRRVTEFTRGILTELGKEGPEAELIVAAARVHDIGKIGVPDYVLQKDGPLAPDELEIMRAHPDRGADLLARYPDFVRGVDIVRYHHERWDGEGYPRGLRGTDIPFGSRVIAVADSFDAMTSQRPYREGMSIARATDILRSGRGAQWDPEIVEAFLKSIGQVREQPRLHFVDRDVATA
jgi:HD-GYP domain-containing protein (c-di-GMP phosphodiesterase class II)